LLACSTSWLVRDLLRGAAWCDGQSGCRCRSPARAANGELCCSDMFECIRNIRFTEECIGSAAFPFCTKTHADAPPHASLAEKDTTAESSRKKNYADHAVRLARPVDV
jgi:hypothetical protein